jgi:hypothetical protein
MIETKLLLAISLCLGLIGIFSKFLSIIIEKIWFKLSEILGYIIPNIILTIIFYHVLFPISILSKIFKAKNSIIKSRKKHTNYLSSNKLFNPSDFITPW